MYNNNRGQIRKYEGKTEFGSLDSNASTGYIAAYVACFGITAFSILGAVSSLVREIGLEMEAKTLCDLSEKADKASRYESEAAREKAVKEIEEDLESLEYADTRRSERWIQTSQLDDELSQQDVSQLADNLESDAVRAKQDPLNICFPTGHGSGSFNMGVPNASLIGFTACSSNAAFCSGLGLYIRKTEKEERRSDWKRRLDGDV